jgi:hypothetical protein
VMWDCGEVWKASGPQPAPGADAIAWTRFAGFEDRCRPDVTLPPGSLNCEPYSGLRIARSASPAGWALIRRRWEA